MINRILIILSFLALVLTDCFAATTQTLNVTANVPLQSGGLTVAVSKIDSKNTCTSVGDQWYPGQAGIAFGTLTRNTEYNIFVTQYYYAVDVGVDDNSGAAWTVTHTRTDFKKDASNNLNSNVNVTFFKQTNATTGTQLKKVSYANSDNVSYTKAQLSGGWLRIYYGIATGDPEEGCTDASGVVPIPVSKLAGAYSGTVTLTVTGL
ncbi:MAG: hypothetical protein HZC15_02935 [Candidatus Omnitrophica bacterium]|nr:hypothetical protein [Candidatus Omnitrophota bacterium]